MPARWRITAAEYLQKSYAYYSDYLDRVPTFQQLFREDYPEYLWHAALDADIVYHNGEFFFNGNVTKYGEEVMLFSSRR